MPWRIGWGIALLAALPAVCIPAEVPEVPGGESQAPDPGERLQPVFQPGNTYRFVNLTEVRMQLPGKGMREVSIEQQARFDATPRTDAKEGVVLKGRTERLKIHLQSGTRELDYDSLKEEDQTTNLGKHFRASLNRSVDLTMNEEYRIVSMEESGRAGIATPLPGLPQFGPDELKQIATTVQQGFPEDPVRPGDEWTLKGSRTVGEVGEMNFDITYRHMGAADFEGHSCVNIEFSGSLSGDIALQGGEGSVFSRGRMDFRGTSIRGRILFDPDLRMVRHNEQAIGMLVDVPGNAGEAPVKVPLEQRATLRLLHAVPTE